MDRIELTSGHEALIDPEDAELWGEFARVNFPVGEVGPLLDLLRGRGGAR